MVLFIIAQVSKSTLTTTTGTQIYQIDATDPENDVLQYTMTCSTSSCPLTINEISMYMIIS